MQCDRAKRPCSIRILCVSPTRVLLCGVAQTFERTLSVEFLIVLEASMMHAY